MSSSNLTVNRRSPDLFPIGSPNATYLPPFYVVVYEILDSTRVLEKTGFRIKSGMTTL